MTRTIALTLHVSEASHDLLVAELADLDFEAFESEPDVLRAWIPAPRWSESLQRTVGALLAARGEDPRDVLETEVIEARDWNATWEASLEPIEAGVFVVAPTWADLAPTGRHVLRVDPKMSFGTGYHESTRLCLRLLSDHPPEAGHLALDVGTGTGVLALAALALGAGKAWGVDVDPWSVPNATENAERNRMADRFHVAEGSLEVAPEGPYGLVLANILKSTILPMLPDLAVRLALGGDLVLAGILRTEREEVLEACAAQGLTLAAEATENEWWAGRMTHKAR
ncbi:MAG: 50S ribosomal protein L11 methyltransferase [Bacteroidota bacterium]